MIPSLMTSDKDAKVKSVPAKVSLRLHVFKDEPAFDLNFNYRSAVCKLNYLAKTARPDIMYAMHQIVKYLSDPRQSHGEAILYLVRYLKKMHNQGLKFKPDPKKGFECYCHRFLRKLEQGIRTRGSQYHQVTKRMDYLLCRLPRLLGLQTSISIMLSTTEAKFIAMLQALHDVIPVMNLLQEMREQNFKVICIEAYVYCKVFEDNAGALELARLPKLHPRTKHINVCYHHFCKHVCKGLIKIFPINTKDQIADALTKAQAQNDF